jgi:serralysin
MDKIGLGILIFSSLPNGSGTTDLSASNFRSGASGLAGDADDFILYNTTKGTLLYDADGSGAGAAIEFALLSNKPAITAADFTVWR